MSAATQGTKTMLEAIECEKQRDRYKAALEKIAATEHPSSRRIAREALTPGQYRQSR